MRRLATPVAVIALLAAGVFAAVSIASGGGLAHGITTGLTTTTGGKVAVCHRTGSKKKPFHTITVAVSAVSAHLKHGDVLGPCTVATVAAMKKHGKGAAKHTRRRPPPPAPPPRTPRPPTATAAPTARAATATVTGESTATPAATARVAAAKH